MKFSEVTDLAFALWQNGVQETFCLLGSPGIGKTSIGRELAKRMGPGALCEPKDLTKSAPDDLPGLPYREGSVSKHAPYAWFHALCQPEAFGVLILDDLPAAERQVQVAARQIALDRSIDGLRLSDRVFVFVTGNRRKDRSAATTLPANFLNAVSVFEVEPDLTEWTAWYAQQPGLDPSIPIFLGYRPDRLSQLASEADEKGAFPSPRSWAQLGILLPYARSIGPSTLRAQASGKVGAGVAAEFLAFLENYQRLPKPEDILDEPRMADPGFLEGRPDELLWLTTGLAQVAARRSHTEPTGRKLLIALDHMSGQRTEIVSAGVTSYKTYGGNEERWLAENEAALDSGDEVVRRILAGLLEAQFPREERAEVKRESSPLTFEGGGGIFGKVETPAVRHQVSPQFGLDLAKVATMYPDAPSWKT